MPRRLVFLLGLVLLAFAGNSLLTRAALQGGLIGAAPFSLIRLFSGALVLAVLSMRGQQAWQPRAGDLGGIISLLIYVVGFTFAYLQLGAGLGALLLFGMVQVTTLGASLRSRQGLQLSKILGLTAAMAGLVFLLSPSPSGAPVTAYGSMMAAGLAWGGYTLLGRGAPDPIPRTARNFVGASVLALPLLLLVEAQEITASGAALAALSGGVTSGLGYALWYQVLPKLSALTAGTTQLLVPPATALLAAVLLREPLTLKLTIATLIIVGGVALTFLPNKIDRPSKGRASAKAE